MLVLGLGLVQRMLQRRHLPGDHLWHHVSVLQVLERISLRDADHLRQTTLQAGDRVSRLRE